MRLRGLRFEAPDTSADSTSLHRSIPRCMRSRISFHSNHCPWPPKAQSQPFFADPHFPEKGILASQRGELEARGGGLRLGCSATTSSRAAASQTLTCYSWKLG